MFYDERLDALVFAGAALIVAGVLWNVRGEAQRTTGRALAAHPAIQPAE
jgi:drug/metabolite transporter (DMT)-like permease